MKLWIATAYAHTGLTNMRRVTCHPDLVSVRDAEVEHPDLGRCKVGHFVFGIGAFGVLFPVDAVRIATPEERAYWTKGLVAPSFADSFKLHDEDFEGFPPESP